MNVDVLRALCELGADPAAANHAGETMLSLAGGELDAPYRAALAPLEALVEEFGTRAEKAEEAGPAVTVQRDVAPPPPLEAPFKAWKGVRLR